MTGINKALKGVIAGVSVVDNPLQNIGSQQGVNFAHPGRHLAMSRNIFGYHNLNVQGRGQGYW